MPAASRVPTGNSCCCTVLLGSRSLATTARTRADGGDCLLQLANDRYLANAAMQVVTTKLPGPMRASWYLNSVPMWQFPFSLQGAVKSRAIDRSFVTS